MNGVRIGVGREKKIYRTTPKVSRLGPGRTEVAFTEMRNRSADSREGRQ